MKRFLIICCGVLTVLLIAGYALGGVILGRITEEFFVRLPPKFERVGLEIEDLRFEEVYFSSLTSVAWEGVSARLRTKANKTIAGREIDYVFAGRRLELSFFGWSLRRLLIQVNSYTLIPLSEENEGISLTALPDQEEFVPGRLVGRRIRAVAHIESILDPKGTLREFYDQLALFITEGTTEMVLDVQGLLTFSLGGVAREVQLHTSLFDGLWRLSLRPSDLQELSDYYNDGLTDAERALLSRYPLRAAELLRLKEEAQITARVAYEADPSVPEDAYRHVLWSYLLSNTFGSGFARTVTDAHELGASLDDPAEREMNAANTRMGRYWAERGIAENELLVRVKIDPKVVRSTEELQLAEQADAGNS